MPTQALFRKNGAPPVELPFQDAEPDGTVWTDLANNAEGREACGWEAAPAPPAFDPETETVEWVDGAWAVQPIPVAPSIRTISRLAFMQRIAPAKRIAIRSAAKTDPVVDDFLDLLRSADTVQLDHADTVAGLGYLVSHSLLTAGEAAAVRA